MYWSPPPPPPTEHKYLYGHTEHEYGSCAYSMGAPGTYCNTTLTSCEGLISLMLQHAFGRVCLPVPSNTCSTKLFVEDPSQYYFPLLSLKAIASSRFRHNPSFHPALNVLGTNAKGDLNKQWRRSSHRVLHSIQLKPSTMYWISTLLWNSGNAF